MKKALSLILAVVMLLSVMAVGTISVSAAGNLFRQFDTVQSYIFMSEFLNVGYSPENPRTDMIGNWMSDQYSLVSSDYLVGLVDENGVFTENSEGWHLSYPADKFEEIAHKLFDFEGTVRDLKAKETGGYDIIRYDEKTDRYIYVPLGLGGTDYRQNGYVPCEDGSYDVYFQSRDLGSEEWDDCYIMVNVSLIGDLVKVNGGQNTNMLPTDPNFVEFVPYNRITVRGDENVSLDIDNEFPEGTVISVRRAASEQLEAAKNALLGVSEDALAVYDISAVLDEKTVQPSGGITVSFKIPENISLEGLKLYYISDGGRADELEITVDEPTRTAAAVLTHFSTYALCNAAGAKGDVNGDGSIDTKDLVRLMKYIALDGEGIEAAAPDVNGDGDVNTADLVRLMKMIASV